MSAMQQTDGEGPLAHRHNRKLAVARHAHGSNAMGWILLGFVLGAGAAIAVLMNADFVRNTPQPAYAVRLALTPRVASPIAQAPAMMLQPARLEPVTVPAITLPTKPAAFASAAPSAPAKASIKKPGPTGALSQVSEDAAAVGMTSRTDSRPNDLF